MVEAGEYASGLREEERLKALLDYEIMDTPEELQFDALTELAQTICHTEIALISFIDDCRQWFKSKIGLNTSETPKAHSFCQYTIEGDAVYEVSDAKRDPLFRHNPLVIGDPFIRFYAGAPLKTRNGLRLGTLCVIDSRPRSLTEQQKKSLALLADQVVDQLELKKSLATNKEISEQKEKLTLMVSHQFRNPVTAIQSNVELIRLSMRKPVAGVEAEVESYCNRIYEQTKDMMEMLNNVLLFRQKISSTSIRKVEPVHLQAFLKKLVAEININLAHGREVRVEMPEDQLTIAVDERELSHSVKNLLSNALKYSSENPTLRLLARKDFVDIMIEDHGIGIPKNEQKLLFQPYFRATNVNSYLGTRLGLSIVKELVENNGGDLHITSDVSKGTTVTITMATLNEPS
ncbi:MAG: GAF domain-containing sensor histidine kinase [Bacteroidota bacterium]